MATDPNLADEFEAGEWLHEKLMAAFGHEMEAWAKNRVRNVESELQFQRFPARRLNVEILWIDQMTAFTLPGRYVYVSRELLQLCNTDAAAAFVVAHEIGHHDLGHLTLYRGRLAALRSLPGGMALAAALRTADFLAMGPENELAADGYALDLCLKAGYDGLACLEVFDHLERHLLNHRDLDGVFGPQSIDEPAADGVKALLAKARQWGWEHRRGYPPLRTRKEALYARLKANRKV